MAFLDPVLTRVPLAGVSTRGYGEGWWGQGCKLAGVVARVGMIVMAVLLMTQVVPLTQGYFTVLALAPTSFLLFLNGSSEKRNTGEVLFELAIASVCMVLVFLAALGTLPHLNACVGILGTVVGGVACGVFAEKGNVQQIDLDHYEEALPPLPVRYFDYLIGMGRDIKVAVRTTFSDFTHRDNYTQSIPHEQSAALCVLLHGLACTPSVLDGYHDALAEQGVKVTIFQPYVSEKGLCSLDSAADGIREEVKQWTEAHPNQPVLWIGHSNGARLSGAIAADLKKQGITNPMQVHCIAGPLAGTQWFNPLWPEWIIGKWNRFLHWLCPGSIIDELSWESACSNQVIENMEESASTNPNLNYRFYATPSDALVYPFTSGFPKISNAHYVLASSEGHVGILDAVQDSIIEEGLRFIREDRH